MKCVFCGNDDSKVLDSRPVEDGKAIRRRRECAVCGKRFTTYERVDELPIIVIKKDDRRELFDRGKILSGLIKACDKRSVPWEILENIVFDIEREIRNRLEREISSQDIGEMVMERLRSIDQVAYVRFASVYRHFEDISTFMEELRLLQEELRKDNLSKA
ncbi:MAG: transcriptional regulator NrdR [Clostridiales bacterium]